MGPSFSGISAEESFDTLFSCVQLAMKKKKKKKKKKEKQEKEKEKEKEKDQNTHTQKPPSSRPFPLH